MDRAAKEDQTCQYLYDSDFRLGSADCGSIWQFDYAYDQYGNITKSAGAGPGTTFSPTYNTTTNRYSSIPGGTVTYDGNGNLTNDTCDPVRRGALGLTKLTNPFRAGNSILGNLKAAFAKGPGLLGGGAAIAGGAGYRRGGC